MSGNGFKIKSEILSLVFETTTINQSRSINLNHQSYVHPTFICDSCWDFLLTFVSVGLFSCDSAPRSASQSKQTCHHFIRRRGRNNNNNKQQNANQDNNNYPRRQQPTTIVRQTTATTSDNVYICQWSIKKWTIHKQQSTKIRTTNGDGHPTMTNTIEQDNTVKFNDRPSMQIIGAQQHG